MSTLLNKFMVDLQSVREILDRVMPEKKSPRLSELEAQLEEIDWSKMATTGAVTISTGTAGLTGASGSWAPYYAATTAAGLKYTISPALDYGSYIKLKDTLA